MTIRATALLGILLAAVCCRAGLQWETDILEYEVESSRTTVRGAFEFTVTGDRPVRITSVQSTCGCTTTDQPLKAYEPGAEGSIGWEMRIPGGTLVQKQVIVTTDDPETPRHVLTIRVERQQLFQVDKRIFVWRLEDPVTPQETEIRVLGPRPVKLLRLTSNRDHFDTTLEPVEPGRRYKVRIKPKSTDTIVYAMIEVHSELDDDGETPLYLFARILRQSR